jgi:hypothetical protein
MVEGGVVWVKGGHSDGLPYPIWSRKENNPIFHFDMIEGFKTGHDTTIIIA